ncbi:hypothetical protein V6x_56670 [Gimesia chilikensis]|uniref:Uncharacterized protein n=1 Tax=Gimesia chilikensis TaxID=2605989 RepID=A0A517WL19_9PLAN|nr:hypothetical protein [Gimesia chilikensis]QDU05923.1 hypothetical protein V6x_56670 [Gimesia chilikensis]
MNRFDILLNWTETKENTIKVTAISDCDVQQYLIDLDAEYENVLKVERQTTCVVRVHYNIWYLEAEQLIFENATEADLFCDLFEDVID